MSRIESIDKRDLAIYIWEYQAIVYAIHFTDLHVLSIISTITDLL